MQPCLFSFTQVVLCRLGIGCHRLLLHCGTGWNPSHIGKIDWGKAHNYRFACFGLGIFASSPIRRDSQQTHRDRLFYILLLRMHSGCTLSSSSEVSHLWESQCARFEISRILNTSLTTPHSQGLISKQYPQERQGELFGVLTGMQQVASAVGPLIFSNLFSYYTSNGAWPSEDPDIVFYISAVVFTASLLLAMVSFYFLREKRVGAEEQGTAESDGEEGLDKQKLFTGTEANGGGVMKRNYEAFSMRIESARLSQGIPFSIQDE